MSCSDPYRIEIPGLDKIPLFKYLKEPVFYKQELYTKYPEGGERGWFAFVYSLKSFVYWDLELKDWKPLSTDSEEQISVRYLQVEQELYIMSPQDTQEINCSVFNAYNQDITHEYQQLDVERDSGDYYSDQVWNQGKRNVGFTFEIIFKDLNFREDRTKTGFKVIAKINWDSIISQTLEIGQ